MMMLIDLLVQELPNRSGWPAGAVEAMSFNHNPGMIHFFDEEENKVSDAIKIHGYKAPFYDTVTAEQYEAALAASQQPVWNGEGLPPVGCECEAKMPRLDSPLWGWRRVKVVISGMVKAENECLVYDVETTRPAWADEFRPIRTEAERKREEAEVAMRLCLKGTGYGMTEGAAKTVFDAIAAGKIPGVKLED